MQQRSEETRIQILEAANRLFSLAGYEATGVAEICAAASVSKGAFYYHFPSKQALFLVLLETWLRGLDMAFEQVRSQSTNVSQALLAMANMAGQVLQSSDASLPIILEFWMQAYRDPAVWEAAIAPYQRYQEYFANLITQGIQEGSLRPVNPQIAARGIVSMGMGLLLQALLASHGTQWNEEVMDSMQVFMYGLARTQP
jgi:AcrR family transcriptional regulator